MCIWKVPLHLPVFGCVCSAIMCVLYQKLHGKPAVDGVWFTSATVRWLDEIEVYKQDELILVVFKDWRLTPEGRTGFIVSGLVRKDGDTMGWQFLHCTAM